MRTKRALGMLATGAAMALAVSGIGWASIPDAGGVVHTCYSQANGTWRPIDAPSQVCKKGETALNLNQTGPQGPQGLPGPQGPQGLQGPPGSGGGITSLDDLEGKGCNSTNVDLAGTAHVVYDNSNTNQPHPVTILCQPTKKALTVTVTNGLVVVDDPDTHQPAYYQGGGTLTVTPPGATIGAGDATLWYAPGTEVTLTANPYPDSQTQWPGECVGATTSCTLTITADTSIGVTFFPIL